jgi:hypothetical protein
VKKAIMLEIKAKYRQEQPVADIVCQLSRTSAKNKGVDVEQESQSQLSDERLLAFTALFTFATHDQTEECTRRSAAMDAVTAVCRFQEPPVRKACRGKPAIPKPTIEESTRKDA